MADSKEDTIRRGYKAFGEGDMETLRSIYTPDVVQSQPGENQLSGEHTGVDNVLGLYGKLFELSGGTFVVTLKSVKTEGDKVVAVHQRESRARGQDPRHRRDHRVHVLGRQGLAARPDVGGPGRRGRVLGLVGAPPAVRMKSPWKSVKALEPDREYTVLASSIPPLSRSSTRRLFNGASAVRKQLAQTEGVVGFSLLARPLRRQYATLSIWVDERALAEFADTSPHRELMTNLSPEMGATKFVRWTISGSKVDPHGTTH